MCEHEEFRATVNVGRLSDKPGGPITSYMADIRISCVQCGKPFQFLGLKNGIDLRGATVSIDGQEANIAICPHDAQPTPLQGLHGFTIRGHN